MFIGFLAKKIKFLARKKKQTSGGGSVQEYEPQEAADKSLDKNIASIQDMISSSELKVREFVLGESCEYRGAILYLDGLVDNKLIADSIMQPLMRQKDFSFQKSSSIRDLMDFISKSVLSAGDISKTTSMDEIIDACLEGNTVFLLEGEKRGLIIGTKGWEKRNISEPQSEQVIRGPREGFTENFRTNTSMLRRKIKHPDFKMQHMRIGEKTSTNVCMAYIQGVANPQVVDTVRQRLHSIDVDSILDAGYIEEYIEDAPYSVFSTVGFTEKPDVAAAKILEGRVGIVVDGSPFVLTVPMLFIESFQTAEDYYVRPFYASVARTMRFLAYFITLFSVPLFITLSSYHQELIPTTLLFTIARAKESTPFPTFIEAILMVFSFEILREAGLRLPRPVGQAISIVGALIMGDAAVAAGLVGAPTVIVVALTAVAGFVVPSQVDSVSILRLILIILATILGGYGVALGFLGILVHLSTLRSFGVAYFNTVIPSRDLQDSVVRMPLSKMFNRPRGISYDDITRRGSAPFSARRQDVRKEEEE